MIPRYSRPEMVALWSPETKFRIWFEIEAHACDAQAAIGVIPAATEADQDDALRAAARAFPLWAAVPAWERAAAEPDTAPGEPDDD